MKIRKMTKLAVTLATLSAGSLLTLSGCSDYAEEFKDEYAETYGPDAKPQEPSSSSSTNDPVLSPTAQKIFAYAELDDAKETISCGNPGLGSGTSYQYIWVGRNKTDFAAGEGWYFDNKNWKIDTDGEEGAVTFISRGENPLDSCGGYCGSFVFGGEGGYAWLLAEDDGSAWMEGSGSDDGAFPYKVGSDSKGLCITYASSHPLLVQFPVNLTGVMGGYEFELPAAESMTTAFVHWYEMTADGKMHSAVGSRPVDMLPVSLMIKSRTQDTAHFNILAISDTWEDFEGGAAPFHWMPEYGNRVVTDVDANGTAGFWKASIEGGNSRIYWPVEKLDDDYASVMFHCGAMCLSYDYDVKEISSFKVGFDLSYSQGDEKVPQTVDVSMWNGICLSYTSERPLYLGLVGSEGPETDDEYFALAYLKPTEDKVVTVDFGWDKFRFDSGSIGKLKEVSGLYFTDRPGWEDEKDERVTSSFAITEIGSFGQCQGVVTLKNDDYKTLATKTESSSSASSSSSAISSSSAKSSSSVDWVKSGKFHWTYEDGAMVMTEFAENPYSGIWYSSDDSKDKGKSTIIWPATMGNEYFEFAFDDIIETCGGVCGTYALDRGEMDFYPYVYVGLHVAGVDKNDEFLTADVAKWEGLCITYSSDVSASFELWSTDDVNESLGEDLPFVTLPKSVYPVVKSFTWDKFKQAGWGTGRISGPEMATKLESIVFKIQAVSGSTGKFSILEIGSYNSCSLNWSL